MGVSTQQKAVCWRPPALVGGWGAAVSSSHIQAAGPACIFTCPLRKLEEVGERERWARVDLMLVADRRMQRRQR